MCVWGGGVRCRRARMRIVDLFCGIGGFHVAASRVDPRTECVLACDICRQARQVYERNFGIAPHVDVRALEELPPHDVLCAGFPCQSFSLIGREEGLSAERGSLVWDVVRLARTARSPCVLLENVRRLTTLEAGAILRSVLDELHAAGYTTATRVLNAMDYGLPQRRRRVFIVAFLDREAASRFEWPAPRPMEAPARALGAVLEAEPGAQYYASKRVQELTHARRGRTASDPANRVWITDKGGLVSHRPYALTLRADPSHNSQLVDGERRFTEREMLRLQGFPDDFDLEGLSYGAAQRLCGNSVPVNVVAAILESIARAFSSVRE